MIKKFTAVGYLAAAGSIAFANPAFVREQQAAEVLEHYCFDCHGDGSEKGGFDLEGFLEDGQGDGTLMFENLLTGKMPPAKEEQPDAQEKRTILEWLSKRKLKGNQQDAPKSFRRISRHEFIHSLNDLLGVNLDLAGKIPEDRGTNDFDSNRNIQLSREMLASYFSVADEMLDHAFPTDGFAAEKTWVTSKVRDSHETYNIYHRPYKEGTLFSWTRANNGNSYSFFYDGFAPPVAGWYELTFDAAKVADFKEDISLQVHAGKYYYADDRPQPQRLVGVISLADKEVKSYTVRAYLEPGESVSVHNYSKNNFRQRNPKQGGYIKQLTARGPLLDQWPPTSYQQIFEGLKLNATARQQQEAKTALQTNLQIIGGKVTVSSFQKGMEKEKMQDGSHKTFWHTRYTPTLAKPPHFVIFENPNGAEIHGLSFATWSNQNPGSGNGLVKAYEIYFSDDGKSWSKKIMQGGLDVRLANEQPIVFPNKTSKRFIKFLVTDAVSLDGKSLASIGKLDVIIKNVNESQKAKVVVDASSPEAMKAVIKRFAEKAFASQLSDDELAPYLSISLNSLKEQGDFVQAAKVGMKAVICSHRFLMAPGEHANPSYGMAADLARALWLSVPDKKLLQHAKSDQLNGDTLRAEIHRMLADDRSHRMVRSLSDQWLNLRSLNKVTPSLKLYPEYDDLLNHYLPLETRAYLHHLVEENLPAGNLIDSDFSFLNQRLAQHYGIDGITGQHLRKVTFPADVPRGGLLTMASVLKVTTDGFDTSPILRGAWISKNIIGTPLSPPPESVPALEPEHGKEAKTLREQIDQHKSKKSCYACHKSIDPYGFALESFDATGEWRTQYKVKQPHRGTFQYRLKGYFQNGAKVDASGEIDNHTFDDIFGLKKYLLSNQRKIAYNFAKKFFEYANGYKPNLNQRLHLWDFIDKQPGNDNMKTLVTEVLIHSLTQQEQ